MVIARSPFSEQTIQLEKRGLCFILQIPNNYFGVGAEEKNNILIHAL